VTSLDPVKTNKIIWKNRAVGALTAIVVTVLLSLPGLDRLHGLNIDVLHLLRSSLPMDTKSETNIRPPVVIIAVDEATYKTSPFDLLPRVMWTPHFAAIQDAVLNSGASVFAWDIVLPTSANTYVADTRYDKPLLTSLLKNGRKGERVILGEVNIGNDVLRPFTAFRRAVGGRNNIRSLNVAAAPDGIVRGVPLTFDYMNGDSRQPYPTMALEIALRHTNETFEGVVGKPPEFRHKSIPTDQDGNLMVRFPDSGASVPIYSFQDIYNCISAGRVDYIQEHFNGRAVILGTVLDVEDRVMASDRLIRKADFSDAPKACTGNPEALAPIIRNTTPGAIIHATAATNLIQGTMIQIADRYTRMGITFALALIGAIAATRWRPAKGLAITSGGVLVLLLIAIWSFGDSREVPVVVPMMATVLSFGTCTVFRVVFGERESRRIHDTFKRYLDPKVIDSMLESGDSPELGGENREMTCFFSDIAKFSTISEQMTPNDLVEFLNEYFAIAGEAIETHGGIIERFEGDAILAVFGAPVRDANHASNAVAAALTMDYALRKANEECRFVVPGDQAVHTRIGINSGVMTVGNVGSSRRYSYTVMGDAVNLAARLEGANKQFGTMILAGEETVVSCGEEFQWLEVDCVRVVGRNEPTRIFCPLGKSGKVPQQDLKMRDAYEFHLQQYRARKFDSALTGFELLAEQGYEPAAFAALRSRQRLDNPPGDGWDGVTTMSAK
jgi:adenylate cyclase